MDFAVTNGLQSDANEEEDNEFANSLLVDQHEYSFEETIHHRDSRAPEPLRKVYFADGGLSSDTDTDTAQTRVSINSIEPQFNTSFFAAFLSL